MFGFKPPLKFMIVKSLADFKNKNAKDIHALLKPEYGTERQFSLETIEHHLQALKTVGIVKVVDAILENDDELTVRYSVTRNGEKLINKSLFN